MTFLCMGERVSGLPHCSIVNLAQCEYCKWEESQRKKLHPLATASTEIVQVSKKWHFWDDLVWLFKRVFRKESR
jgi:hypothetical protein